jgi:hypothetical protein
MIEPATLQRQDQSHGFVPNHAILMRPKTSVFTIPFWGFSIIARGSGEFEHQSARHQSAETNESCESERRLGSLDIDSCFIRLLYAEAVYSRHPIEVRKE